MAKNKLITVNYSERADKDLEKIDKTQASKIVNKIAIYTTDNPLKKAKKLKGNLANFYRYRIGNYRAIFSYEENVIILIHILRVKHRKDIYEN